MQLRQTNLKQTGLKQKNLKHKHITSFQIIILGFMSVIILGSIMLMMPAATRDGKGAVFSDALFTPLLTQSV